MLGQAQVGQSHSKRRKRKGAKATGPQQAPDLARQIHQIFKVSCSAPQPHWSGGVTPHYEALSKSQRKGECGARNQKSRLPFKAFAESSRIQGKRPRNQAERAAKRLKKNNKARWRFLADSQCWGDKSWRLGSWWPPRLFQLQLLKDIKGKWETDQPQQNQGDSPTLHLLG